MKGDKMKLTPPTKKVFWVATVLAAVGLVSSFVAIPFVSAYAFWFVVVGFVLLWLGNTMKGF
jgi:fatty acid desaturase